MSCSLLGTGGDVDTGSLSRVHEGTGEEAIDTKVVAPHNSHFHPDLQHFNIRQETTAHTPGTIANKTAKTVRLVLLGQHLLGCHHPCEICTVYVLVQHLNTCGSRTVWSGCWRYYEPVFRKVIDAIQ